MSLALTRVQDWVVQANRLDKNMTRPSRYGAYDFFRTQTDAPDSILSQELKDASIRSIGTTVKVPVIKYDANVTIGDTRSCVIQTDENTSEFYVITYTTLVWGFTMVPTQYQNNYITYQHDFDVKMRKYRNAVMARLDEMAVAALDAAKTQVFGYSPFFDTVADVVDCPWDRRTGLLSSIEVMMEENDYFGQLHIIGNGGVKELLNELAKHGYYNDENQQYEYQDYVFHFTNTTRLPNEDGYMGTGYAVESGNVGILFRIPDREALRGTQNVLTHSWDIINFPMANMPVAVHTYQDVGDQSALNGEASADMVCVVKEYYGFAVEVAFITAYNSDPDIVANPIIAFQIQDPGTANPFAKPVVVTNGEDDPVFTTTV